MVAQFYIYSRSGKKLVYKSKTDYKTKITTFFRNTTEIDETEFNKALAYFQSHR